MNPLSDLDLLTIWERGAAQHAIDRALTALGVATARPRAELAGLAVGWRDAALLELYRASFGGALDAATRCPACGEAIELAVPVDALRSRAAGPARPEVPEQREVIEVVCDGVVAVCRQPTSRDLAGAARAGSAAEARAALLAASVIRAARDGAPLDAAALPDAVIAQIEDALAEMSPPAEILLSLACPACGHAWAAPLDLVAIVWRAIDRSARSVMEVIAALAERYGWTEADSLTLPRARRRYYLERARS